MDELLDLAIRHEVTLHFVDRTLLPPGDNSASLGTPFTPGSMPISVAFHSAQENLREIAANTGGTFVANIDLYEGVKQAMDVERAGYYVGYYTDRYLSREHMAKVSVRVSRRGARISHRRGSYAGPSVHAAAPIVRGGITLARPQRAGADRLRIPFQISAAPQDLGYEKISDSATSNFTLHVRVEDPDGRVLADSYHFVNHAYPWDLWVQGNVEPILINGWVELPPGDFELATSFKNLKQPELGGELRRPIKVASRAEADKASGASDSGVEGSDPNSSDERELP
jgi:hypothetical protein